MFGRAATDKYMHHLRVIMESTTACITKLLLLLLHLFLLLLSFSFSKLFSFRCGYFWS